MQVRISISLSTVSACHQRKEFNRIKIFILAPEKYFLTSETQIEANLNQKKKLLTERNSQSCEEGRTNLGGDRVESNIKRRDSGAIGFATYFGLYYGI